MPKIVEVDGIRLSMSSTLKEHALIAEHEAVAAAEIAEHMITHQPYRAWCSQCVAHRGRQESEENLLTVVVIHDRQTKGIVKFASSRMVSRRSRSVTAPVEDHEAVCWLDKSKSSAAPKVVLGYLRTSAKGLFLTRSVRRLVEKADCEQEGCSSTGDPVEAGTQDAPLMTSRQAAMQARSGEAAAAEDEEVDWAFTYKELDLNAIESKLILPRLADEFELARLGNMKVVAREDHCGSRDQGAETGVASQIPVLPAMFTYLQEEATEVSYEDSVTGRRSGIPGCLSAFVMK